MFMPPRALRRAPILVLCKMTSTWIEIVAAALDCVVSVIEARHLIGQRIDRGHELGANGIHDRILQRLERQNLLLKIKRLVMH